MGRRHGSTSNHAGRNSDPVGDGLLSALEVTRAQIDRFVLEAVADAAAVDVASLGHSTSLLDIYMDSLTLVAIVTRMETTYGAAFDDHETAELLRARTVGDVAAIVARKLRAS
jgi:acyl carrier protein